MCRWATISTPPLLTRAGTSAPTTRFAMPKVCLTSDWHGTIPQELPEHDLLVIAGDICPDFMHRRIVGRQLRRFNGEQEQLAWLRRRFLPWCEQHCAPILFIAGNHDFVFE